MEESRRDVDKINRRLSILQTSKKEAPQVHIEEASSVSKSHDISSSNVNDYTPSESINESKIELSRGGIESKISSSQRDDGSVSLAKSMDL